MGLGKISSIISIGKTMGISKVKTNEVGKEYFKAVGGLIQPKSNKGVISFTPYNPSRFKSKRDFSELSDGLEKLELAEKKSFIKRCFDVLKKIRFW